MPEDTEGQFKAGYDLLKGMPELGADEREWAAEFGIALISYLITDGKKLGRKHVSNEAVTAAYGFALAVVQAAHEKSYKKDDGL